MERTFFMPISVVKNDLSNLTQKQKGLYLDFIFFQREFGPETEEVILKTIDDFSKEDFEVFKEFLSNHNGKYFLEWLEP